jgi:hypothetical protein
MDECAALAADPSLVIGPDTEQSRLLAKIKRNKAEAARRLAAKKRTSSPPSSAPQMEVREEGSQRKRPCVSMWDEDYDHSGIHSHTKLVRPSH